MRTTNRGLTLAALNEMIACDPVEGKATWKFRPLGHFRTERDQKAFNSNYAGRQVGYLDTLSGYVGTMIQGRRYWLHQVIFAAHHGYWPHEIDHINGNRSDNRIINLRDVPHIENTRNQRIRKNNTSGHLGVNRLGSGRWRAYINKDGKHIHLGCFGSRAEALQKRKEYDLRFGFHENHGRAAANAE